MIDPYDVIVAGAGSAGCVIAARLSEDPRRKVLLLEAGPVPFPIPEFVADAEKAVAVLLQSPYLVMYPTRRDLDGSEFYSLAGRIAGGGSSVNMMAYPRPIKADLDGWAALGNPDWAWEKVLPVLKRVEADQDFPDGELHGGSGPVYVKRKVLRETDLDDEERALVAAAARFGLPYIRDHNTPNPFGVAPTVRNVKDGRRQSAAVAYLEPALRRPNLTVMAEAQVVSLGLSGDRVREVRYRKDGETRVATADQIVLSAGVYHTPQVLMLSGIGAPAELERHGIRVVHALPGVGENYHDHAVVTMTFKTSRRTLDDASSFSRRSTLKLYFKSDPARDYIDFHIIMRERMLVQGVGEMISFSLHLLEQSNRGRVTLASADPAELPCIEARMLEHPEDIRAMLATMKFVSELAATEPLDRYIGPLFQPGPAEDWERFARTTYTSYFHGVGTCKMGPAADPMAVVNQRLRVYGLSNLWVADASIMPNVVHANTNFTCMMIGERLADLLQKA